MTKLFSTKYLTSLGLPWEGYIQKCIKTVHRWYTTHEIIFEDGGQFWKVYAYAGNTENQEMDPWDHQTQQYAILVEQKEVCRLEWMEV